MPIFVCRPAKTAAAWAGCMAKVIGIDPGLAGTGIGIVEGRGAVVAHAAYGHIATDRGQSLAGRLDDIFARLTDILREQRPDMMVVEDIFSVGRFPHSAILLGKVTGVILLAGYRQHIPVAEIAVREAKKVLTGNGRASKSQLENAVRHHLKLPRPIRPYHAADALGLALIGLMRYGGKLKCQVL